MLTVHPPMATDGRPAKTQAVWFDLLKPTESESSLIQDHLGYPAPSEAELSGIEESSRLSFSGGALRLAMPIISEAETDHPTISHVGFLLTPQTLVTVRYKPLRMFDAVASQCSGEAAPASGPEAFASLMEAFVARQADLLEQARARLDRLSHRVFRNATNERRAAKRSNAILRDKLQTLGRIGERISMIRESLLAFDRAISFALDHARPWFPAELVERLKAVREDIAALGQFEEHLLGKVQFLLDAVLGFISIEQNDIFKVLTIASVVGIFPTLVAGWYGMNFHNMPEYAWAYGYEFGIGLLVISIILPLLWFKWRGWL